MRVQILVCAAGLWLLTLDPSPLAADELVTDRPDQTESSSTVERGRVQIETGWLAVRDDEDGVRTDRDEVGGTLVRIGLAQRVEARIGWAGQIDETVRAGGSRHRSDGSGDAEVGFKVRLPDGGTGFELAAMLMSPVPTGAGAFRSDAFEPEVRFLASRALARGWDLGINLGVGSQRVERLDGGHRRIARALYTVALGHGLGDRWGVFVEAFGEVGASRDAGPPAHSVDAGVTYLVRDHIQLDLAVGYGLSESADDSFVGIGLSVRLPN